MYTREDPDKPAEDIKLQKIKDTIEKERLNICQRGAKQNLVFRQHKYRIENELYANIVKAQTSRTNEQLALQQEEKLSQALEREKIDRTTELKIRQQLGESCPEIRELEAKLRAAYTMKEQVAQMAEKEYFKTKEKLENVANYEKLEKALRSMEETEKLQAENDIKKKAEYRQILQDQMILKYQERQQKYEEFLKEKKRLDTIVQRIYDEDMRELEDKMCRMKKAKEEIDAFKAVQEIWRSKEKKRIEEENIRLQEYLQKKEAEEREKELQKMASAAAREQAIEAMAKKIYIGELKKKERENIILELLEEEANEKEEQKLKEAFEQQIQDRIQTQAVLAEQLYERKEKMRQAALEDARYKEEMMKKIEEDEKLEQLSAEKRRQKKMQLRRDIEDTINERRAKRAEELQTLLYIKEQDAKEEQIRKTIIEEERLRLLKMHASNLIGYLPPGILREDDLPHLNSDVANFYKK